MPPNRMKSFPTALLRRGLAHFRPALARPGHLPPADGEGRGNVWSRAGGPSPEEPVVPGPAVRPPGPAADLEPFTSAAA